MYVELFDLYAGTAPTKGNKWTKQCYDKWYVIKSDVSVALISIFLVI